MARIESKLQHAPATGAQSSRQFPSVVEGKTYELKSERRKIEDRDTNEERKKKEANRSSYV